jgi:hypothetical protein
MRRDGFTKTAEGWRWANELTRPMVDDLARMIRNAYARGYRAGHRDGQDPGGDGAWGEEPKKICECAYAIRIGWSGLHKPGCPKAPPTDPDKKIRL